MTQPVDEDRVVRAADNVRPGTLAELAALGDELAALIRAGVPLEAGLAMTAADLPPRLGKLADDLSRRLSHGESLTSALAAERPEYPPALMAVVEAGLRSGRAASAIEGLADTSHRLVELRAAMGYAVVYPLFVCLLGYTLTVLFMIFIAPVMVETFAEFGFASASWLEVLSHWGVNWRRWVAVPPLLLIVTSAGAWLLAGRPSSLDGGWLRGFFSWLPGMRRMFANWETARLASLLALLVEQRVPWPEALRLAGAATASRRLSSAATQLAEATEAGRSAPVDWPPDLQLPPLVRWALSSESAGARLPEMLRQTAVTYHQQALADAELLRTLWPTIALVGFGGSAVLLYALILFRPLTQFFYWIAQA